MARPVFAPKRQKQVGTCHSEASVRKCSPVITIVVFPLIGPIVGSNVVTQGSSKKTRPIGPFGFRALKLKSRPLSATSTRIRLNFSPAPIKLVNASEAGCGHSTNPNS